MSNQRILIISFPEAIAKFYVKAKLIRDSCTGNVNFSGKPVTDLLALLVAALIIYGDAMTKPVGRKAAVTAAREAVSVILRNLAIELEKVALGDRGMLGTTGYDLAKIPVHNIGLPTTPTGFAALNGPHLGEIAAKCKPVIGADTYDIKTTLDLVNGPWEIHTGFSNSREMLMAGFVEMTKVHTRIRSVNKRGKSEWGPDFPVVIGAL